MAISDGLNNGNVLNGGVRGGLGQQMIGTSTERPEIPRELGKATHIHAAGENISSERKEGYLQHVTNPPPNRMAYRGGGSEIWFPPTQIKKMLGDHLRSATRPCKFCYHDLLKDAPNPGLFVKGFGPIAFPFLERDIDRIIEASKHSGMQQEVEDVLTPRAKWEVPSDMIELRNPSWGRLLVSVLSKVSSELEIEQTGRGILASEPTLILHEPNSVVDPIKW